MNGKRSKLLRAAARSSEDNTNTEKTTTKKVIMRKVLENIKGIQTPVMRPVTVMHHTYSHAKGSFRSNLKEEKRRYYGKV